MSPLSSQPALSHQSSSSSYPRCAILSNLFQGQQDNQVKISCEIMRGLPAESLACENRQAGGRQGCNHTRSSTTWPSLGSMKEPGHQETRSHASDRRSLHDTSCLPHQGPPMVATCAGSKKAKTSKKLVSHCEMAYKPLPTSIGSHHIGSIISHRCSCMMTLTRFNSSHARFPRSSRQLAFYGATHTS